MSELGDIIRRQRELQSLSMRQFAAMTGISNPYLSQIERGLRRPSERVMEAIADALDTSVDTLYDEAGQTGDAEDDASAVREAIATDPHLTGRQRQALIVTYDAMLAANAAGHPRRS